MQDYGSRTSIWKPILIVIGVAIVGVLIIVGMYQGSWWLQEDAVNRNSQINNDSYARQSGLADQIIDLHKEATRLDVTLAGDDLNADQKEAVSINRESLVNDLCDKYAQTTGTTTIPEDIHSFAAQEC